LENYKNDTKISEFDTLRKANSIGEIAFLKLRKIPIIKTASYYNKTNFWFENAERQSDIVLAEYYSKDYIEYFETIQQTRKELFDLMNKQKQQE